MLVYTTLNHVKYCLPNGDSGIIRTLDVPVYITKVSNQVLFALDREGKNRQIQVSGDSQREDQCPTTLCAALSPGSADPGQWGGRARTARSRSVGSMPKNPVRGL